MTPLPNEKTLIASDDDRLVLTTHRVRFQSKAVTTKFSSIMLEEVSECKIVLTSKPVLLLVALVLVAIAVSYMPHMGTVMMAEIIVAAIFLIGFIRSCQYVISVRSAGGAINVPTKDMKLEKATEFIDALEAAKDQRFHSR